MAFETVRTRRAGMAAWQRGDLKRAYAVLLPIGETANDSECHFILGQILAKGADGLPVDRSAAIGWLDFAVRGKQEAARKPLGDLMATASAKEIARGKRLSFVNQQRLLNHENHSPNAVDPQVLDDLSGMSLERMLELGSRLNNGDGYPTDYAAAFACFSHAADLGDRIGQYNRGVSLYAGKGVDADPVEALRWFRAAAEQDFGAAATMAGVMLTKGEGAAQNGALGLTYLEKAARLGDSQGMTLLNVLRSGGKLV
jgi:TPR repeat protein